MKSLTPELTIRQLGWTETRRSLRKAISHYAPRPYFIGFKFYRDNPRYFFQWFLLGWLSWPFRTIKLWRDKLKHYRTDYVKGYVAGAKAGFDSRTIFKKQGRPMHLTEDEIFEQGNRILRGEGLPPFQHAKEINVGKQI